MIQTFNINNFAVIVIKYLNFSEFPTFRFWVYEVNGKITELE